MNLCEFSVPRKFIMGWLSLDRLKWGISGAVILAAVVVLATMVPGLFSTQSTRLNPISDNQSLKDAPDENFESVEIEVRIESK